MVATGEPYPVILDRTDFTGWRTRLLAGEVAECNAFHPLGGVAAHAGLFATADDLLVVANGLLGVADFPAPEPWSNNFCSRVRTIRRWAGGPRSCRPGSVSGTRGLPEPGCCCNRPLLAQWCC